MKTIFKLLLVIGAVVLTATIYTYIPEAIPQAKDQSFFSWLGNNLIPYFDKFGELLGAMATVLLAFAAFWVISDTRHFRHLDAKTAALQEIREWAQDSLKELSSIRVWRNYTDETLLESWINRSGTDNLGVILARGFSASVKSAPFKRSFRIKVIHAVVSLRLFVETGKVTSLTPENRDDMLKPLMDDCRAVIIAASELEIPSSWLRVD